MSKEKKSFPAYTMVEKVGLGALVILGVFLLTGWGLCYSSFNGKELTRPGLNFAGLIVMLILPGSASLVFGLFRRINQKEPQDLCQEIWEKFFVYMPFAALIAFYYAGNQGFTPPKIIIILVLSWIAASIGVYQLNHFLRRVCLAEGAEKQS